MTGVEPPFGRAAVVLTDEQWAVLEPLVEACRPPAKVPPSNLRRTIGAIVARQLARIMRRFVPMRANSKEMANPRISLQKTPQNRHLRRSSVESMAWAWGGTRRE